MRDRLWSNGSLSALIILQKIGFGYVSSLKNLISYLAFQSLLLALVEDRRRRRRKFPDAAEDASDESPERFHGVQQLLVVFLLAFRRTMRLSTLIRICISSYNLDH